MDDMTGIAARLPAMSAEVTKRLDAALAYPQVQAADRAQLLATRDALLGLVAA
jgi:beta-N-acetylhexosaminidase